jgi:hypothetical protein
MRILTKEHARELLKVRSLDDLTADLSIHLQLVGGTYSTPVNSGAQVALSKLFAYLVLRDVPVCLYVTGWSVAPSTEHLDLFYGYRRSIGDVRLLMEAPFHVFEPTEQDALVSVLSMTLFFFWDVWMFDLTGESLLRLCHDGWLELRARDGELAREAATELERFTLPSWPAD